jgi:hypothetical protein
VVQPIVPAFPYLSPSLTQSVNRLFQLLTVHTLLLSYSIHMSTSILANTCSQALTDTPLVLSVSGESKGPLCSLLSLSDLCLLSS